MQRAEKCEKVFTFARFARSDGEKLASDYLNDELGRIHVDKDGGKVTFRFHSGQPKWPRERSPTARSHS